MAERSSSSRSSNSKPQAARKKSASGQSTRKSSAGSSSRKSKKPPRLTKEEIAQQSAFHDEVILISTLVAAILLTLANFHMCGSLGNKISQLLLGLFGTVAYVIPVAAFIMVAFHISNRGNWKATKKIITGSVLVVTLMTFLQLMTFQYNLSFVEFYRFGKEHPIVSGGIIGGEFCKLLTSLFGEFGAFVILLAIFLICFMIFTGKTPVTTLSKKSGQSLHEMRDRHRENAALRQEYYQQQAQERALREQEREMPKKRKAKTFDLKKTEYEVDEATGEIKGDPLNTQLAHEAAEPENEELITNIPAERSCTKKESKCAVEMEEIQPNLDNLSITGAYVSSSEVPGYESELNEKFGKCSYGGQAEDIENNLGSQVTDLLNEENMKKKDDKEDVSSSKTQHRIHSREAEHVMAQPAREANVHIEEVHKEPPVIEEEPESNVGYMDAVEVEDGPYLMPSEEVQEDILEHDVPASSHHETVHEVHSHTKNRQSHTASQGSGTVDSEVSAQEMKEEMTKELEKPYVYPPLELLAAPKKNARGMTEHDLKETAGKLQKTLESFGVRATITNVTCGPSVTRYEIQPEQGVKVSTITKLSDDIKLNLAATDIRIEAPIPGKAAVGIEVPNKENTMVYFRELIDNKEFMEHPSDIAFAVGKDIGGKSIITDIAKMPHLMIAGATGSGKSVCINTLIMSILYKADPKDVKLIMVDPKVVELSVYNGIPHLLIPVVTDPKKASTALNWAVVEMEERYRLFAELGVREIKGYNAKIAQVEHLNENKYKKMPQIVIIVDELADLMMVLKGEVEEAICRLAQKARAAGIHLVLATQRPSVNVITGLIKANVPSRVAFAVSSAVDSRTILDGTGAEKLLGKGDMLFFPYGYPKPVRLQGAFISDKEVNAVVDYIKQENGNANYSESVSEHIASGGSEEVGARGSNDRDEYFVQAGKFIIEKNKASIGMLQRVYKIGFNRAARIMDQLCDAGVVGPEEGTKPRKVVMSMEEFEQYVEEYV